MTDMYLWLIVWTLLLIGQHEANEDKQTWTSIGISTCSVPMANGPFSLCCITENVPEMASIFFYRTNSINVKEHVIRISPSCDLMSPDGANIYWKWSCALSTEYTVPKRNISITYTDAFRWSNMYGGWGCGFYGNISSTTISENDVLTEFQGYKLYHHDQAPQLQWSLRNGISGSKLIKIYDPGHNKLYERTDTNDTITSDNIKFVNYTTISLTVVFNKLSKVNNGTYVLKDDKRKLGITLVVIDQPTKPVITNLSTTRYSGNTATGLFECMSKSQSAAPLHYLPDIVVNWLLPGNDSGYVFSINGNALLVSNIRCSKSDSLPIYCFTTEDREKSFTSQPFYPSRHCQGNLVDQPSKTYDSRITGYVVALSIFVVAFVFTWVIMSVIARKFLKMKLKRCCKLCCSVSDCCRNNTGGLFDSSDSDSDIDEPRRSRHRMQNRPPVDEFANPMGLGDGLERRQEDIDLDRAIQNSREQAQARDVAVDNIGLECSLDEDLIQALAVSREIGSIGRSDQSVRGATASGSSADLLAGRPPQESETNLLKEIEQLLHQHNSHLSRNVVCLEIHRDNILHSLIAQYTDPTLATSRVTVKMIGEDGMDCGGVTDDLFTTFWNHAQDEFFLGCDAVVPYLPPHKIAHEENYRVLGRILSHSVAILKAFPLPMCKSTIVSMIYDTTTVAKETLQRDFLLFLDVHDRGLVTKAMTQFSTLSQAETDEIQSIFERFDFAVIARADTFANNITDLARHLFCLRPKNLLCLMREGFPPSHLEHFWTRLHLESLDILFRALKPTPARVIARLQTEDNEHNLPSRQKRAFGYLKDFLVDMSDPEIETFLQFVTGKKTTPRQKIMVTFTHESGLQRAPKAHTCSNLLELPDTYSSYESFKSEMKNLLASDEAMLMSMA